MEISWRLFIRRLWRGRRLRRWVRRRLWRLRRMIGIGYREPLASWIASRPPEIQCLEVTAEHFFTESRRAALAPLRREYPLLVHGLGLSLGTPGPLDRATLDRFTEVVKAADPLWISEHVAFTRTPEVDLGHLNPVRPDPGTLALLADHARELSERCGRPLLLENIASYLRLEGEMPETEFLNRLCERAGCGLLLDVTNLYVNAMNHGFDPMAWVREIDPARIVQLHAVGYSRQGGRWHDFHAEPIQEDLWDLLEAVRDYAPVQAVILERDTNFPPVEDLGRELGMLRAVHV